MEKYAICDDEKKICADIEKRLHKLNIKEHTIISVQSIGALEEQLRLQGAADVLFLDIEVREDNGIDAAARLQQLYPEMAIIFITGHIDYAREIFKAVPAYFLVKPFTDEEIGDALKRARELRHLGRMASVVIMVGKETVQLYAQNIYYAESSGRMLTIVTADQTYTTYMKLDQLQEKLPEQFLRAHKSYLVNMNYIRSFSAKAMTLYNGAEVPVSRRKYQEAKETYLAYFA